MTFQSNILTFTHLQQAANIMSILKEYITTINVFRRQ